MLSFNFKVCPKCEGLLGENDYCSSCNSTSNGVSYKIDEIVATRIKEGDLNQTSKDEIWNGPATINLIKCPKCKNSFFKWFSEPKSDDEPPKITYCCCSKLENEETCGTIFYTYK